MLPGSKFSLSWNLSVYQFLFLHGEEYDCFVTNNTLHSGQQTAATQQKMNNLVSVDVNRIEQCFAAHIVHSCQQYSSALLHLIQAQQHCSILSTVQNNVGSKTLFNPVLINAQQVFQFLLEYVAPLNSISPVFFLFCVDITMVSQTCQNSPTPPLFHIPTILAKSPWDITNFS